MDELHNDLTFRYLCKAEDMWSLNKRLIDRSM